MACLFTQTTLDDEGFPVRDPGSSTYLATFEPAERFSQLVDDEARRRGCQHIRQPVIVGDGAVWICYPDVGIADLIPVPRLSPVVPGLACGQAGFRDAGRDNQRRSRKSMMSSGGR
jgi:hypothetical protein